MSLSYSKFLSLFLLECSNGTYGYECQTCSEHCVNSICEKFSENGDCLYGCEVGYTTKNCTEGMNLAVSIEGTRLEKCILLCYNSLPCGTECLLRWLQATANV